MEDQSVADQSVADQKLVQAQKIPHPTLVDDSNEAAKRLRQLIVGLYDLNIQAMIKETFGSTLVEVSSKGRRVDQASAYQSLTQAAKNLTFWWKALDSKQSQQALLTDSQFRADRTLSPRFDGIIPIMYRDELAMTTLTSAMTAMALAPYDVNYTSRVGTRRVLDQRRMISRRLDPGINFLDPNDEIGSATDPLVMAELDIRESPRVRQIIYGKEMLLNVAKVELRMSQEPPLDMTTIDFDMFLRRVLHWWTVGGLVELYDWCHNCQSPQPTAKNLLGFSDVRVVAKAIAVSTNPKTIDSRMRRTHEASSAKELIEQVKSAKPELRDDPHLAQVWQTLSDPDVIKAPKASINTGVVTSEGGVDSTTMIKRADKIEELITEWLPANGCDEQMIEEIDAMGLVQGGFINWIRSGKANETIIRQCIMQVEVARAHGRLHETPNSAISPESKTVEMLEQAFGSKAVESLKQEMEKPANIPPGMPPEMAAMMVPPPVKVKEEEQKEQKEPPMIG